MQQSQYSGTKPGLPAVGSAALALLSASGLELPFSLSRIILPALLLHTYVLAGSPDIFVAFSALKEDDLALVLG